MLGGPATVVGFASHGTVVVVVVGAVVVVVLAAVVEVVVLAAVVEVVVVPPPPDVVVVVVPPPPPPNEIVAGVPATVEEPLWTPNWMTQESPAVTWAGVGGQG